MDKVTMTRDEWLQKGKELFGEDMLKWRFVCPSCSHVQTPEDFRPYSEQGVTPDTAYMNCIGRYDGHGDVPILSGQGPCNYTSGGLFNLNPIKVIHGAKGIWAFAFDTSEEKATKPE